MDDFSPSPQIIDSFEQETGKVRVLFAFMKGDEGSSITVFHQEATLT